MGVVIVLAHPVPEWEGNARVEFDGPAPGPGICRTRKSSEDAAADAALVEYARADPNGPAAFIARLKGLIDTEED